MCMKLIKILVLVSFSFFSYFVLNIYFMDKLWFRYLSIMIPFKRMIASLAFELLINKWSKTIFCYILVHDLYLSTFDFKHCLRVSAITLSIYYIKHCLLIILHTKIHKYRSYIKAYIYKHFKWYRMLSCAWPVPSCWINGTTICHWNNF